MVSKQVQDRLNLAEQAAAQGNYQAAINYANAAMGVAQGSPGATAAHAARQGYYEAMGPTYVAPAPTPNPMTPVPSTVPVGPSAGQRSVAAGISAMFAQYGLGSLAGLVEDYVMQGYSGDTIALLLRQTPEYQARFPAMKALAAKGRAISEGQYIDYEQNAAALESRYGIPAGMLTNNVTKFLEAEKSAAEIAEDVQLAAVAAIQSPQWIRDQFNTYYGLNSQSAILAHYLDPDLAAPELQKMYATTVIGAEAEQRGIDLARSYAERLQGLGVDQTAARQGFGTVAGLAGLSAGRGDLASQQTLIDAALAGDTGARNDVQRAQASRTGRFQSGGGYIGGQQGVGGLGRANN